LLTCASNKSITSDRVSCDGTLSKIALDQTQVTGVQNLIAMQYFDLVLTSSLLG